jgi:nicotinate-nucleotide adenylyltransferase
MRVALFGGTFDPPHRGHVALARLARKRLALDRILVAPVGTQPLKQQIPPTSFADRLAMTRFAFAGEPGTEVSLLDASHPDGTSNYTIDTLAVLRCQLAPGDHLFCILGADSFLTIRNWHRAADLLLACDFIVGARPGFDLADAAAAIPPGVYAKLLPSKLPHTRILELEARKDASKARTPRRQASRLYLLTDLAEDISATQIRAVLGSHSDPAQVLNPSVAEYIHTHHLYKHL